MENHSSPAADEARRGLAGRYLTVSLGQETYGIGVLSVREILRMTEIVPLPKLPPHFKGVLNLRGKVIPVLDLRCKFGLARIETTQRTCIVLVQVQSGSGIRSLSGLIVDAVEEVVDVPASEAANAPDFGGDVQPGCIFGMVTLGKRVILLLDVDRVVKGDSSAPAGEAVRAA